MIRTTFRADELYQLSYLRAVARHHSHQKYSLKIFEIPIHSEWSKIQPCLKITGMVSGDSPSDGRYWLPTPVKIKRTHAALYPRDLAGWRFWTWNPKMYGVLDQNFPDFEPKIRSTSILNISACVGPFSVLVDLAAGIHMCYRFAGSEVRQLLPMQSQLESTHA